MRRPGRFFLVLWGLCAALACSDLPPAAERAIPSELPEAQREAARRLSLDGAHNFRDLGGYTGADGRRVRWGALYRSDKLVDLSDADLDYLSRLGLRRVIDFRSEGERERDPDRIPAGAEVTLLPIEGRGLDPAAIEALIREGGDSAATGQLLVDANVAFVTEFDDQYRDFLQALADDANLPLLFHCTAGKDRAGFAAALALLAAGVPRDVVMDDYLLTQTYTADHVADQIRWIELLSLGGANGDAIEALFAARREYLQAAFDTIDKEYGSTEAYLRDGLDIDAATLVAIRSNLLE